MEETPIPEKSSPIRRLASQSSVYAIGNMLLKAAGLVLAPVYLNPEYLLEVEFGTFALLEVTGQITVLVVGLGLHAALMKHMSDVEWKDRHDVIPFTVLVTVVVSVVAIDAMSYSGQANKGPSAPTT